MNRYLFGCLAAAAVLIVGGGVSAYTRIGQTTPRVALPGVPQGKATERVPLTQIAAFVAEPESDGPLRSSASLPELLQAPPTETPPTLSLSKPEDVKTKSRANGTLKQTKVHVTKKRAKAVKRIGSIIVSARARPTIQR
jgi:hypothetical protein